MIALINLTQMNQVTSLYESFHPKWVILDCDDRGDIVPLQNLLRSPPRPTIEAATTTSITPATPQSTSEQFSSSPIKVSPALSSPSQLSFCGGDPNQLESPLSLATSPYRSPFRFIQDYSWSFTNVLFSDLHLVTRIFHFRQFQNQKLKMKLIKKHQSRVDHSDLIALPVHQVITNHPVLTSGSMEHKILNLKKKKQIKKK